MRMDQEPDIGDEPLPPPTREEQEADAWEYWHQRARQFETAHHALLGKAMEMRNAIDALESAMMGLGDFVDLPDLFEDAASELEIAPRMSVGEMRRVCTALEECTKIINSDEFTPTALKTADRQ